MLLNIVLTYLYGYVAVILFLSLGYTVYSFYVGVYVVSLPGYSVDRFLNISQTRSVVRYLT
jgi:hypothetical protein